MQTPINDSGWTDRKNMLGKNMGRRRRKPGPNWHFTFPWLKVVLWLFKPAFNRFQTGIRLGLTRFSPALHQLFACTLRLCDFALNFPLHF
jgi:hypothetical protein